MRSLLSQGLLHLLDIIWSVGIEIIFLEPQLTQFNNMPSLDRQISMCGIMFMTVSSDLHHIIRLALQSEELFSWNGMRNWRKIFQPITSLIKVHTIKSRRKDKDLGEAHVRRSLYYFLQGSENSLFFSFIQLSVAVAWGLKGAIESYCVREIKRSQRVCVWERQGHETAWGFACCKSGVENIGCILGQRPLDLQLGC